MSKNALLKRYKWSTKNDSRAKSFL